MTAVHTDGNGIAGMLTEIFTTEITRAERVCQSCGSQAPVGAHRVYQGAGVVLRCPTCGDVGARIGVLSDGHVLEMRGTWVMAGP